MERRLMKVRELDLFEDCSPEELQVVDVLGSEIVIPAGRLLMGRGHAALECVIVVDGTAVVSRDGKVIGTEGPGSILGEMALLRHVHRNATVTTATPVTAIVLNLSEFYELLRVPSVRAKILRAADVRTIVPSGTPSAARSPHLVSVGW